MHSLFKISRFVELTTRPDRWVHRNNDWKILIQLFQLSEYLQSTY